MPKALPPAGWYPHPEKPHRQLYWDGTAWTDQEAANSQTPAGQRARQLGHSEKIFGVASSKKDRDRSNARRVIAGLEQTDVMIELLGSIDDRLAEQGEMLRRLLDERGGEPTGAGPSSDPDAAPSGG